MILFLYLLLCVLFSEDTKAQTLPSHNALRVLIVSDEVNPHNLTDEELTQPGDISQALASTSSLNTSAISEFSTDQLEQATVELLRLNTDPMFYDILIYFAHRNPSNGNNAQQRQEEFVNAVEFFLINGGGVIAFHHGIYLGQGKQSIQNLFGAQATGSVPWDTKNGQDVIFVGGEHFIGSNNINYPLQIAYENTKNGIDESIYPAFNNTPDERYPNTELFEDSENCNKKILFESDYVNNGNQHLLGYTKYCDNWLSEVFMYQPGEYQPHAFSGNNFQILLNAIYYLSNNRWDIIFSSGFE